MSAIPFYPPFHPHSHSGASAPIFQPHPPPILFCVVSQCACVLVLPHGSHTGTLGLPDGFWLPERFGFPSAYSSPIHVVFLDRVFHSARVGITWHSRAAGFAPPNLGNSYVILSCSIYHTHREQTRIGNSTALLHGVYGAGNSHDRSPDTRHLTWLCKFNARRRSASRRSGLQEKVTSVCR